MRDGDRGSASIWVVAGVLLLFAVAAAAVLRECAVLARHRAEGAADLAALAGAERIGVGGEPCSAARVTAADNGAHLVSCRVRLAADGRSGTVSVEVRYDVRLPVVGSRAASAAARAGRLPSAITSRTGR